MLHVLDYQVTAECRLLCTAMRHTAESGAPLKHRRLTKTTCRLMRFDSRRPLHVGKVLLHNDVLAASGRSPCRNMGDKGRRKTSPMFARVVCACANVLAVGPLAGPRA